MRRALTSLLLVALVASAALLLSRLAPGDHLSTFGMDPGAVAAERARLGLDRPLAVQYLDWIARLMRGDLGESTAHPGRPISSLIATRAANGIWQRNPRFSAATGFVGWQLAALATIPGAMALSFVFARRSVFASSCSRMVTSFGNSGMGRSLFFA